MITFDTDGLSSEELDQVSSVEEQGIYKVKALIYEIKALSEGILDSGDAEKIILQQRFKQIKNVIDEIESNIVFINDYFALPVEERLPIEQILGIQNSFEVSILEIFIKILERLNLKTPIKDKYKIVTKPNIKFELNESLVKDIRSFFNKSIENHKDNKRYIEENSLYIVYRLVKIFYDILDLNKDNIEVIKVLEEMGLTETDGEQIEVVNRGNNNYDSEEEVRNWLNKMTKEKNDTLKKKKTELMRKRFSTVINKLCTIFYNEKLNIKYEDNSLDGLLRNTEGLSPDFKEEILTVLNNTYKQIGTSLKTYISQTDYYKGRYIQEFAHKRRLYYIDFIYIENIELKKGHFKKYVLRQLRESMSNLNPVIIEYIEQFGLFDILAETLLNALFNGLQEKESKKEKKLPVSDKTKEKYGEYIDRMKKSYE